MKILSFLYVSNKPVISQQRTLNHKKSPQIGFPNLPNTLGCPKLFLSRNTLPLQAIVRPRCCQKELVYIILINWNGGRVCKLFLTAASFIIKNERLFSLMKIVKSYYERLCVEVLKCLHDPAGDRNITVSLQRNCKNRRLSIEWYIKNSVPWLVEFDYLREKLLKRFDMKIKNKVIMFEYVSQCLLHQVRVLL